MKGENKLKKNLQKKHKHIALNNMLHNNQGVTEYVKEEIKKCLQSNEKENTAIQSLRFR